MICSFPRPWSGRVFLTSFLSTYAFHRPWVGHIGYLFVHGLDGAQIRCPRFLSRLILGRAYLVMKGILALHFCRPETFVVHGGFEHRPAYGRTNIQYVQPMDDENPYVLNLSKILVQNMDGEMNISPKQSNIWTSKR